MVIEDAKRARGALKETATHNGSDWHYFLADPGTFHDPWP